MTRVLVTGAGGFVGTQALAALLSGGYDVCAVGRRKPSNADVMFVKTDLLDPASRREAVRRTQASHLLHLAWVAVPGVYWRAPENLDWTAASLDLLRCFREAGGKRAVVVGSCAEYAWGAERFHELTTPCEPATLYGSAKDATRRLSMAYAREVGLSVAWGRLFFLYGPGERPGRLVSDAVAALRSGRPLPTSHGRQKRDFLHVTDVARALVALLGSEVEGPVNIGSGRAVAVRDILGLLAKQLGGQHLVQFGARPQAESEPAVIEADIGRLASEVGFRPTFDLASGLADVLAKTR